MPRPRRGVVAGCMVIAGMLPPVPVSATAGGATPAAGRRSGGGCAVVVEGEVREGQAFRRPIRNDLVLAIEPVPHGWILRVLPAAGPRPAEDMAELATPPFRSINPLLLTTDFGMRAQDAVGWNPRSFRTLRAAREIAGAERAFDAVVATAKPTPAAQEAVVRLAAGAAEGRLEVLDARLVPGTGDQTPAASLVATHFLSTAHTIVPPEGRGAGPLGRIEWLRFRVTLDLARAAPGPHPHNEVCR